jgi:hypothetical protein
MNNKKIKCLICDKKFSSLMKQIHTCRCGSIFCNNHMHTHICSIDYIELNRKQQETTLINITAIKIDRL